MNASLMLIGDKLGLYLEVVQQAIAVMRETSEESMRAPDDAPAAKSSWNTNAQSVV